MSNHAPWVLPISGPPVRDGWVEIESGRVVEVGQGLAPTGGADRDLGNAVLMPGLVNSHTHLELSFLRDAVAPSTSFVHWIRQVMAARREHPDARDAVILQGVADGIVEARSHGTSLVGDISNSLVTFESLTGSPLGGVVFYELLGFRCPDPAAVVEDAMRRLSALISTSRVVRVAAHAPYSVAAELIRAIRQAIDRDRLESPYSIHLAESPEEVQFMKSGSGPWRSLLEELDVWEPSWVAPGVGPVQYLDQLGFFGPRALAVHGVQMSPMDMQRLAERGTTLVVCPRSNAYTGVGSPPLEQFYASGIHVAIGTDSLASVPDLSVFAELAAMHALAPSVPASVLLDSATRQGAIALGFGADYGTIEPGKRADLVAVALPRSFTKAADVEEFLVSGVQPDKIGWID